MRTNVMLGLLTVAILLFAGLTPASATAKRVVPVTQITSGPADGSSVNLSQVQFGFESSEPNSTFECRLDDGEWAGCANPYTAGSLTEGEHSFSVRATDGIGDTDPAPPVRTFTVDLTAPAVSIDSAPPALSNSIHASFTFSSEAEASAECRLDPIDAEGWGTCESPAVFTGLADGPHRFEVRTTDLAGNLSEIAFHDWTVETVKPNATITVQPATLTGETSATFEFTSDNGAATFECRLDPVEDTDWASCETPVAYLGLEDGDHRFEVRAVDADAGAGPVSSHDWTVDTLAPTVEITEAPAAISGTPDPSFAFSADEPIASAECRLDPVVDTEWTPCESPSSYTGLADGEHRFEVRATDAVGHTGEPVAHVWIVETIVPTATIISGPSGTTAEISAWFGFTSDNENAGFECRLDPEVESGWTPCESGVEYNDLTDGEHNFEVRAVGVGAGPGPVVSRSWTIDTVVPEVTIESGPAQPTNERTATFDVAVNKPGFNLECRIDAEDPVACTSPVVYADLAPGDHSFVVEASDGEGEVVDSALWQWTILAEAPLATVVQGPSGGSNSKTAVFRFISDVPEAGFECRIDGAAAWSTCTSPAGYSGLSEGTHNFEVRARLAGNAAGTPAVRAWTVDTTAPSIALSGGPAVLTTAAGASFTLAVDDQAATVECRLDEHPWMPCADEVSFEGLSDGPHSVRIRAVDSVGNTGLARRDWSVDTTAPATTLTDRPAAETTAFSGRFAFTADEPGSTFECRTDGGNWKRCSSPHRATGLLRGGHTFAVRATDAIGNTGEPVNHHWRIVAPAAKGVIPKLRLARRVRLDSDGTARLATVKCPEGRCRILAAKRAPFKLGGQRFTPGIKAPRGWYRERSVEIMLITSAGTRSVVGRHGPARIRIDLVVESDNGKRSSIGGVVTLVAGR